MLVTRSEPDELDAVHFPPPSSFDWMMVFAKFVPPLANFRTREHHPSLPLSLPFIRRTHYAFRKSGGGLICLLARCSLRLGVHQFACMLFLPSFSNRPRTTRHERTPTPPRSLPHYVEPRLPSRRTSPRLSFKPNFRYSSSM